MSKKPVAVTLRKPQAPVDVDSFVGGPKPQAPVRATATAIDAVEVQHGAREYREMTLYLPTEVARALSFYCMDRNCDVNRVVAEALTKHVAPGSPETAAADNRTAWHGAVELLIEHSRVKLSTLWALRPWT